MKRSSSWLLGFLIPIFMMGITFLPCLSFLWVTRAMAEHCANDLTCNLPYFVLAAFICLVPSGLTFVIIKQYVEEIPAKLNPARKKALAMILSLIPPGIWTALLVWGFTRS